MGEITFAKWAFNDRCNLRCPYCLATTDEVVELPFSDLCKIMDKMYDKGVRYIDFFGKEPLFDDTIFSLIKYAKSKGYDFSYSFISNGKNLLKYAEDILDSGISSFTISYDGGYGGRKYIFDLNDISPFLGIIPVEFSVDVHRNNVDHLGAICDELIECGADSIYFKPIIPHEHSGDDTASDFYLSQQEYLDCIRRVAKEYEGFPLKFSFPLQFSKVAVEALSLESPDNNTQIFADLVCEAGNGGIFIASNGYAYGCGVIHYDNCGKHCVDFLSASDSDLDNLKPKGKCKLCLI